MVHGINHGVNSSNANAIHQNKNSKPEVQEEVKTEAISKVDQIKKEIEEGTYKINLEATAKSIADTLI